jgi:hypothetical protein
MGVLLNTAAMISIENIIDTSSHIRSWTQCTDVPSPGTFATGRLSGPA